MNYVMEGNTNFQNLLMEAICAPDDENNKLCLISNQELEKQHIILQCKHTFNYIPLFKEIVKQKKKPQHARDTKTETTPTKMSLLSTSAKTASYLIMRNYEKK